MCGNVKKVSITLLVIFYFYFFNILIAKSFKAINSYFI